MPRIGTASLTRPSTMVTLKAQRMSTCIRHNMDGDSYRSFVVGNCRRDMHSQWAGGRTLVAPAVRLVLRAFNGLATVIFGYR